VRIPYVPVSYRQSIPSLGGGVVRYRPVMAVRLTGPRNDWLRDGLLDTGADETIFGEIVATIIGLDLDQAEARDVGLVGRPQPVRCRYAPVRLRITDGLRETYEWTAVVGFAATRLRYPLLGHSGFLQFFDAEFRGADRAVILTPNRSFPGTGP
jgi:hypothetical protein